MTSQKKFNIYIDNNYQTVCKAAALHIVSHVQTTPHTVLGLATGDSPKALYKYMVFLAKEMHVSFSRVRTFNLDEYVGLSPESIDSYRHYMNINLFNHLDFNPELNHLPNVELNPDEAIHAYQMLLDQYPIDLQILGIGTNGHIGFNEPGTPFEIKTHLSSLADTTLLDNQKHIKDAKATPTHAITMGISDIMRAKTVILVASGKHKKKPIYQLVHGPMHIDFPASILQQHDQVFLYLDQDAAQDL